MSIDLTTFLPDPAPSSDASTFPGIEVPDPTSGSIAPIVVNGCIDCRKAPGGADGSHYCWQGLYIPEANRRAAQQEIFDYTNAVNLWYRKVATLSTHMHFAAANFCGFDEQNYVNATNRFTYKLKTSSASVVTLQWDGDPASNPHNLPIKTFSENGEWSPGDPASGTHYQITTENEKLPARGKLKINWPSILSAHGGFDIEWIDLDPPSWDFDVHLRTPIGSDASLPMPNTPSNASMTASIEFYVGSFKEGWPKLRDVYPLWASQTEYPFSPPWPSNMVFTIAKRCRWHSGGSGLWVSGVAQRISDGEWVDVSSALHQTMKEAYSGGTWQTWFTLSALGAQFGGYDSLVITVWAEQTTGGEYVGQKVCAHDRVDWSGSHGKLGPDGKLWFCDRAATASGLSMYRPGDCYLAGVCNAFEQDEYSTDYGPMTPFRESGMMENLTHGLAFRVRQLVPGIPVGTYERMAPPGLLTNCPTYLLVPGNYGPIIRPIYYGGWESVATVAGLQTRRNAFEIGFSDTDYGPAGDNLSSRLNALGEDASANVVDNAQSVMASCDFDPYLQKKVGTHGQFQTVGSYELVIPNITQGKDQNFPGGRLEFGPWGDDLLLATAGGTYPARIVLDPTFDPVNRYPRSSQPGGATKVQAQVYGTPVDNGDGTYDIELRNQVVNVETGRDGFGLENDQGYFCCSGTNVAYEDAKRVNNSACAGDFGSRGPRMASTIRPGDAMKFDDDASSATLEGKSFLVTGAWAAAGTEQQKFYPGSRMTGAGFDLQGIFIPYPSASEVAASIVVTRATGTVTLEGERFQSRIVDGAWLGPLPFPLELPIDRYAWSEGVNDAGDKGIILKVSHLNQNSFVTDLSTIHVVVTTNGVGVDAEFNLVSNGTYGIGVRNGRRLNYPDLIIDRIEVVARYTALDPDLNPHGEITFMDMVMAPGSPVQYAGLYNLLEKNEYIVLRTELDDWTVFFPAQHEGSHFNIVVYFNDTTYNPTNHAYFEDQMQRHSVSFPPAHSPTVEHGGLPWWDNVENEGYAALGDVVRVKDAMGLIAAEGSDTLIGRTFSFGDFAVAAETPITVKTSSYDSAVADVTKAVTDDYLWHGADGKVWLKFTPGDASCIFLQNVPLFNRRREPSNREFSSIRKAYQKALGE